MNFIQKSILFVFTMITLVIETLFRVCLFPLTIVILILMQLCGLKSIIRSDTWYKIWKYSMPWNFGQCHITDTIANYLAPDEF